VPLSIFGALVPLNLGLASLNIYTQVGLITLVGLITKHGILMVEFANQQREQGMSKGDAIVERPRAPAADPDDHRRHGAGRRAADHRQRRRRGGPFLHRPGDRRRHVDRHALHDLRAADLLHPDRPPRRPRREEQPEFREPLPIAAE
jgi:hypothetical protein